MYLLNKGQQNGPNSFPHKAFIIFQFLCKLHSKRPILSYIYNIYVYILYIYTYVCIYVCIYMCVCIYIYVKLDKWKCLAMIYYACLLHQRNKQSFRFTVQEF